MSDLSIPDFLLVDNRRKLSPERQAWVDEWLKRPHEEARARWRQLEDIRRREKERKTRERINALRISKGLEPIYE